MLVVLVGVGKTGRSGDRGRAELGPIARRSIIACVVGLEDGAPQSRVGALVGILKDACRGVMVRAKTLDADVERWRGCGLLGVSVDVASISLSERELSKQLPRFAARAVGVVNGLMACSVPSRSALVSAWGAGFTHISGSVLEGMTPGLQPTLLDAAELWRPAATDRLAPAA